MGDHEITPICQEKFKQLDDHIRQSPDFRDKVLVHAGQILTLEKAHEATMQDIREIKSDISTIKADIKDLLASVKIWVLSGVVGTILMFSIPTMMLFYNAGQMSKQIEVTAQKVEAIK